VAPRLVLVAHAVTSAVRLSAFPLDEGIEADQITGPVPLRAVLCRAGPELRCMQTAQALGWAATADPGLADLDAGRWNGLGLGDVFTSEPDSMSGWLRDVDVRPHGGESLSELIDRVGAVLDGTSWPDGRSLLVTSPLVIRAAVVHLLGTPRSFLFSVDVGPLSATVLTGHAGRWKLRGLLPWGSWDVADGARSPL
jgi:broad specificity phosphatase PhoE